MSDSKSTALTVVSSPAGTDAIALVRPGSPLAHALDSQGVNLDAPAATRAVSKAVQSLAKDIMEGAMLLQADTGHEGARRAQACLVRVRNERARNK